MALSRAWSSRQIATMCAAAALGLFAPVSARSQVLHVVVLEAESERPIAGALVQVSPPDGPTQSRSIAGANGRVALDVRHGGRWVVTVSSLGYETQSRLIEVLEDQNQSLEISLAPLPVELTGFDVSVSPQCSDRSRDPAVAGVWLSTRESLLPSEDLQSKEARYELVRTTRETYVNAYEGDDRQGGVIREGSDTLWVSDSSPFHSESPESLIANGFIEPLFPGLEDEVYQYQYHAPSPEVLFSEAFASTHCFFLRTRDGWEGLGFEPNRTSDIEFDVEGTLWIPNGVPELPYIEFRYTRYPHENDLWGPYPPSNTPYIFESRLGDRVGGRIELAYLPEMGWMPSRYLNRTPMVRRREAMVAAASLRDLLRNGRRIEDLRAGDLMPSRPFVRRTVWWLTAINESELALRTFQYSGR